MEVEHVCEKRRLVDLEHVVPERRLGACDNVAEQQLLRVNRSNSNVVACTRTFPRSDARCDLFFCEVLVHHTEVVLEAALVIISELKFDLLRTTTRIITDSHTIRYRIAPFAKTRTLSPACECANSFRNVRRQELLDDFVKNRLEPSRCVDSKYMKW